MTDQLKRAINEAKTSQAQDKTSNVAQTVASSDEQTFDMTESSYKTSHTAVRKARRFAMQGLYEWLVTDRRFEQTDKRSWKENAPHDIAARTRATNAMHTVHIGYYHEMMRDIPEQIEALDALISEHLDRDIDKLDTVEHAILLIGAYELQNRIEIPYKVVLDEAMKLNNHFGATDAHKLINAVLDRMAIELRALEVQADTKANQRTSQKAAAKAVETSLAEIDPNTDTEAQQNDAKPASNKPRISANKTGIKRSSANKTNASTAIKQAAERATKETSQQTSKPDDNDDAANIGLIDSNLINDNTVTDSPKSSDSLDKIDSPDSTDNADKE